MSILHARRARAPSAALLGALRESMEAGARDHRQELRQQIDAMAMQQQQRIDAFGNSLEALRERLGEDARAARGEINQLQQANGEALRQRIDAMAERNDERMRVLRESLVDGLRLARVDAADEQKRFGEALGTRLAELTQRNDQRLTELRETLEKRLVELQADNARKLEQMRETVDEKLHQTLETRLTESFGNVAEMLAKVHQGLGDMHKLAADVGGLQRVLTNVKSRGVFGEVQLAALLEQALSPDQYASNVVTVPGSNERVEFAIRFPGSTGDSTVWLPIDAKFPREDYERLLDAQERSDADTARSAGEALERRVRNEAARITAKYVAAPHTTEFAILFLPTEGLYAEVLRRPGLVEAMQRDCRVALAGPTTLLALLTSFQMGFRTLAIEKRSSEVWRTLGAVKTEFAKFGGVLDGVKKKLVEATNKIDATRTRTNVMNRQLRDVEALPLVESLEVLGLAVQAGDDADAASADDE
ncbi:DNA recombination protein RmuC [Lysobacter sp. TY2-98]|uniref:DNA recombination protein RmuC n=1 Tax=Lysobacter sp. TY2-98 TaxID=2290922 RepID=UPI001F080397|nr:DNA recombination protein RmuC [Lysobacter sp. TY2-98]